MIKIIALSDMHGFLPELESCDLVLICGDSVPLEKQASSEGTYKWYKRDFSEWAHNLDCDKVLFIAGNHDLRLENHYTKYKGLFSNEDKVTYLCDELYEYNAPDGNIYRVYGTPWCKQFGNWAFMADSKGLTTKYSEIPNGVDILITHDQPYLYGDILMQDCPWNSHEHIGNQQLLEAIQEKKPRYQFNGHLHSCDHNLVEIGDTKHYNVSLKDERYSPVYEPLMLDIE